MIIDLNNLDKNMYFTYRTHGMRAGQEEDFMMFLAPLLGAYKMGKHWYLITYRVTIFTDVLHNYYIDEYDGVAYELVMLPHTSPDDMFDDSTFGTVKIIKGGEKDVIDEHISYIYDQTQQILAQSVPDKGADRTSYEEFLIQYNDYINVNLPHLKL